MGVLVEQAAPLGFGVSIGLERLRRHRRDDLEESHELIELAIRYQLELHAERSDRVAPVHDRHTDEAGRPPLQMPPPRRAIQKQWLLAHVRHDDGLRALHDTTENPFTE